MEARIISKSANQGGHHRPHCCKSPVPAHPSAQATVDHLIGEGAEAILSFGLAGGLDPRIPPGALMIPEGVLLPEQSGLKLLETDRRWRIRLVNLLSSGTDVHENPLLCSFEPVLRVADKAKLHQDSEAGAVDMEIGADRARGRQSRGAVPGVAGGFRLRRHGHTGSGRFCHDQGRSRSTSPITSPSPPGSSICSIFCTSDGNRSSPPKI